MSEQIQKNPYKEEDVSLSQLRDCPVTVTFRSSKNIERIAKTLDANAEDTVTIDVAQLKDQLFIIDGHTRVDALRLRGFKQIRARVRQVEEVTDVIILHVRLNQTSPIDPLRLMDAVDFLLERNIDAKAATKLLWLDDTQNRLLKLNINPEARISLGKYMVEISTKYSRITLPHYVIELLAKIKNELQSDAAMYFIRMNPSNVPEHKFGFPSIEQIDIAFSNFAKEGRERKPVLFENQDEDGDDYDDADEKEEDSNPDTKKKSKSSPMEVKDAKTTKEEEDEARTIIGDVPHLALLQCAHGTKYRVDMKNHTISEIKEGDMVTSIEGDDAQPVYMIPSKYAEFLNLDHGDSVYFKSFTTAKQLQKFVDKTKERNIRTLVVSTEKI